jgi:hypothetical protein
MGNDAHSGTSPNRAWKTIDRANRASLQSGDRILFAGDQRFEGCLRLTAEKSGEKGKPIVVSSFGHGRPTVVAGTGDGIVLAACAYVAVRNIDVVGCGRKNGSDGAGIRLERTRGVEIADVDASGFRLAGVSTAGDVDTRIIRVHAHDNGAAGIVTYGGHDGIPRSRNLYIGDCRANNNPGDPKNLDNHSGNGIVVGGLDGGTIEYCEASNNGWDMPRVGNGPVGIWGWNCDRLVIQHCISHHNKSPGADGGGFDLDGGVTNSVMQYNLSYDNVGCGYLLCQYGGAPPWKNNVVRYNISVNDGSKNFQAGIGLWLGDKGISDALIYNNTIVNPNHAIGSIGDLPGFLYRNNIFVVGGSVLEGDFTHSRFERNLYWQTRQGRFWKDGNRTSPTLGAWSTATGQETAGGRITALATDPLLRLPPDTSALPTEPRKLAQMMFYRVRAGSPCLQAGIPIAESGGRDLFGRPVPAKGHPSLGAHEPPQVR